MRINENHLFLNPELRTREQVQAQATEAMNHHGLDGWSLVIDNKSKRRAGVCKHSKKQIGLTLDYALKTSPADLEQTIIHEIAHALTPWAHHGPAWKAKMRELGKDPERCHSCTWTKPEAWIICTLCKKESGHTLKQLKRYRFEENAVMSHKCGQCRERNLFRKSSDYEPTQGWIEIDHWSDQAQPEPEPQPELEPTPEPLELPDTIRCPRVSVFPSTIHQPSFLDDMPVQTFEREPGKATFVHDKNKQLSLFE